MDPLHHHHHHHSIYYLLLIRLMPPGAASEKGARSEEIGQPTHLDAGGVLGGDGSDDGGAVCPQGGAGLNVGLDAGAGA